MKLFTRTLYRVEGQNGNWQPVFANDVANAALNILKMDESIGQTYDLGGPHVYSVDEIYEQFFNATMIKPYIVPVPLEKATSLMRSPLISSFERYYADIYLKPHFLIEEALNVVCRKDAKGFKDLHMTPISFGQKVPELVQNITWKWTIVTGKQIGRAHV